jgi:outer membrane protein assembly factor BamB
LRTLDGRQGKLLRERKLANHLGGLLPDPLLGGDQTVFLSLPGPDGRETVIEALAAASGQVQWNYSDGRPLMTPLVLRGTELFVGDGDGHLIVLDARYGNALRTLAYPAGH